METTTRPAFLDDPIFDLPPYIPEATSGPNVTEEQSQSSTTEDVLHQIQTTIAPLRYSDLNQESMHLDIVLFNTLSTILQGSLLKVTTGLRGNYA